MNIKNVGTGKRVDGSSAVVSDGNGGNNYSLSYAENTNSSITPKALTITGTTAANRVYDGTDVAAITVGTLSGFVPSETVVATATATGQFDSRNAGSRTATATYTLANGTNGGLATNYSLASTSVAATITPYELTVTGLSVPNRFISLGNDPIFAGTPTPVGVLSHREGNSSVLDSVSISGTPTGTFSSFETLKILTVTINPDSLTPSGPDGSNYVLRFPTYQTTLFPQDIGPILTTLTTASTNYTADIAAFGQGIATNNINIGTSRAEANNVVAQARYYMGQTGWRTRAKNSIAYVQGVLLQVCPSCRLTDADWAAYGAQFATP